MWAWFEIGSIASGSESPFIWKGAMDKREIKVIREKLERERVKEANITKEKKAKSQKLIFLIIIVACLLVLSYISFTGFLSASNAASYDNLAHCLTAKGVRLYTLPACADCIRQKLAFGAAQKFLHSVDCSSEQSLCSTVGIESYPTWIINNTKYSGRLELVRIGELSKCGVS